jgi:hypothetical protein
VRRREQRGPLSERCEEHQAGGNEPRSNASPST